MPRESDAGLTPDSPLNVHNSVSIGSPFATSPLLSPRYPYRDVRVSDQDRLQHVYMVGMTGAGKSNALKNMIAQDLQNPQKGVIVITPEDGLLKDLLPHLPAHRRDDLVYFDPTMVDGEHVIGWNPLDFSEGKDLPKEQWQPLYQQKVGSVFKVLSQTFEVDTEPQKELLREALYGLVALDQVSLKDIDTLLNADESTLRQAIADSRRVDERTRHFWRDYDHDSAHQTSAIALRRKLVSLFHEPIATLFASHAFTWRELLAQPRIVFIDLSQIGSPAKETVAELTLAEIGVEINRRGYGSRETIPYHLYLDAFTDFMRAGASTHELLTKGRKNGLGLTLTHQSHAELPDSLEGVIMGNVKTLIIMRVNDQDAHVYARALQQDSQGSVTPSLLQNLQMGQAIVRLEVDGVPHCVAVQMPRFK